MTTKCNMLRNLLLGGILFLFLRCDSHDEKPEILFKVFIDNPTNEPYVVFFNGQKNSIRKNKNEVFELEKGEYHFKAVNKNTDINA